MQKFNVGDKVLVKARVEKVRHYEACSDTVLCDMETLTGNEKILLYYDDLIPASYKTYEDGLNDAWTAAVELVNLRGDIAKELFPKSSTLGDIFARYTAAEVMEKITEWEKANELHVGDVGTFKSYYQGEDYEAGVVTNIGDDGFIVLTSTGDSRYYNNEERLEFTKAGRTIDIEGLLKEIGGGE